MKTLYNVICHYGLNGACEVFQIVEWNKDFAISRAKLIAISKGYYEKCPDFLPYFEV